MNSGCKIGLVMLTCTTLGAFGSEALHSEARPAAYLIGQIDVTDPDGYAKEYLPKAREIIKAHRGKLVAAAGAAATGSQVVAVDGNPPKRVVIYMYPSRRRFWLGETIQPTCKFEPLARDTPRTTHLLSRALSPTSPDRPGTESSSRGYFDKA